MSNTSTTNELQNTVKCGEKIHHFTALAMLACSPEDFFLDPVEFYLKHGGEIPAGEHWEIEIHEPNREALTGVHLTTSEYSVLPFVCYPCALPTLQKAEELFRVWCTGTVMKLEQGVDINDVYKGDNAKFLAEMEKRGIKIVHRLMKVYSSN